MKNNAGKGYRHGSLRLKGYDYTSEGMYYITICTNHRQHYFGEVTNGKMFPGEIGKTAEMYLKEVSKHFINAVVAEHVVMPNHVHLILVINDRCKFSNDGDFSGGGPCHGVGPCHGMDLPTTDDTPVGSRHGVTLPNGVTLRFGKPVAGSVSVIINHYKASVKRWCNKNDFGFFKWQPRFYDHIIRNEEYCSKIVTYMRNNPKNWKDENF